MPIYFISGHLDLLETEDETMTRDSTDDIAWVRSGREQSGTVRNFQRRTQDMGRIFGE